jgi:histone acetyltransferase (RNA polymerase elongator complex component)
LRPVVVPFFISHLGCPHRCVFCDQEKIAGARGALPDAAEIDEKIAQYRESSSGRELEVAFFGGTFTALPQVDQHALLDALQPHLASGTVSSVRLSTRPDAIDAGNVSFLKDKGVRTVELGVQSMDDEVLQLARRGHSPADVERAVALLRQAGVEVGVQLMPGLPGDTPERSIASLERVISLAPDFLRIYPTLVIAGTDLADLYCQGKYRPLSLDEAVSLCKEMLKTARRAAIPVIRLGLQPTTELEAAGTIVAGPYHPAFGQLVESEICYERMSRMLSKVAAGASVTFYAPAGRVSDLVGQKRRNLARLRQSHEVNITAVREDAALPQDAISMELDGKRVLAPHPHPDPPLEGEGEFE